MDGDPLTPGGLDDGQSIDPSFGCQPFIEPPLPGVGKQLQNALATSAFGAGVLGTTPLTASYDGLTLGNTLLTATFPPS